MKRFLCAALFAAALASTAYAADQGLCCGRTATANFAAVPMPPLPPAPMPEGYSESTPVPANLPPTMSSRRASAAPSCSAAAMAPSCSTPAASAYKPSCSTALTARRPATAPTCAAAAPTCAAAAPTCAAAAPTCEANSVTVVLCPCECCNQRPNVAGFLVKQVVGRPLVAVETVSTKVAAANLSARERALKVAECKLCQDNQALASTCVCDCHDQARVETKAATLATRANAIDARRASLDADRARIAERQAKNDMHRDALRVFSGN